MIIAESILLLHLRSKQALKRHEMKITPETTFKDLQDNVRNLYKIDGNPFDLFVQQIGRQVLLSQDNFQHFKDNSHLIKIVKVTEYDVQNCTTIQFKEENKVKEANGFDTDLLAIANRLENDYSSFLADDFEKVVPSLELVCDVRPTAIYSQEEKQALRVISSLINSDRLRH